MDSIISIGEQAPDFELLDIRGQRHSLQAMLGKIVVLNFWSAECPWSARVDYELLACLPAWRGNTEAWWLAANANEPLELIERVAGERKLPTVLLDSQQHVADLYGAQTTPHFFVIDKDGRLAYQGAWDDITFRQRVATRVYVPGVIEALINRWPADVAQTPAYGCVLVRNFETT